MPVHRLEQMQKSERGAKKADRFPEALQASQIDHPLRCDEVLTRREHAEHVAERRVRGFVGMRGDDEKRSPRHTGQAPSLAHRGLINFQCAEMVLTESFAGCSAGAESFGRFPGGEAAQVRMFESFLRDAGDLAP